MLYLHFICKYFIFYCVIYNICLYSHGKAMFHSISKRNGGFAASDLFHMITQSIKFYIYVLIRARTFEKYDS